jgi:type VI secretion system protein ImpG
MYSKYYQDELAFLREMGKEFSQSFPALAHMLAERGSDPDVERLLEGFAFLAGRIRQKLDDEFPEVTHGLLNLIWPNYLRPIPSMSILEFQPVPGAVRGRTRIPRGTAVASIPVEGTKCRFRTCNEVNLYPIELASADIEERAGAPLTLRLGFKTVEGASLKQMGLTSLRLFLWGEPEITSLLYLWILRNLREVVCQGYLENRASQQFTLPVSEVRAAGFSEDEALLPYPENSFAGFRLLQEYFALPAKFMFVDVGGLDKLADLEIGGKFEILFRFSKGPEKIPRITAENFRLFCTPIVNLFEHNADPIRLDHERVEYRVRPASVDAHHFEIYSVERVMGWAEGQVRPREYAPFFAFTHDLGAGQDPIYYQIRLRSAVTDEGTDSYVSFVSEQEANTLPPVETISVDLICTNRNLPGQLRVRDIVEATESSPEFATFQNISRVTGSIRPPMDQGLHWRLLSHLALNYLSLTSPEALRSVLGLYNFQALYDRQAARASQLRQDAIQKVSARPMDWLVKGVPIRGTAIELDLVETDFSGEGDLYLFATILNEVFSLYASINSFTRLTVRGVKQGEIYQWAPRLGSQILV